MVFLETKSSAEFPRGIEEWIVQIETTWENIPEFKVDQEKLKHLVIICDGNRRAAEERKLKPYFGHQAGIETIKGIALNQRYLGSFSRFFQFLTKEKLLWWDVEVIFTP